MGVDPKTLLRLQGLLVDDDGPTVYDQPDGGFPPGGGPQSPVTVNVQASKPDVSVGPAYSPGNTGPVTHTYEGLDTSQNPVMHPSESEGQNTQPTDFQSPPAGPPVIQRAPDTTAGGSNPPIPGGPNVPNATPAPIQSVVDGQVQTAPQRPQDPSVQAPPMGTPPMGPDTSQTNLPSTGTLDPSSPDYVERRKAQIIAQNSLVPPRLGPDGNPLPKTADDVNYEADVLMDRGTQQTIEGLAAEQAAVERQQALKRGRVTEFDRHDADLTQRRVDTLDYWMARHREFWDRAQAAQAAADAAHPNPDDLLGGRGSWARSIALALAASGAGIGDAGITALINNQVAMQWASRGADYGRLRQRAADALGNAEEATATMKSEDEGVSAMQNAYKSRLANELLKIETDDPTQAAKLQQAGGKMLQDVAKEKVGLATSMANADLKNQQMLMKGYHYDSKLHRWVGMDGSMSGGGSGGSVVPGGPNGTPNPYGKTGAWDYMTQEWRQYPDEKRAAEAESTSKGVAESVRLIDHVLSLKHEMPGTWQKLLNKAGLTDEESAVIQTHLADAILAFNRAHDMKRLTSKEEEIYREIGADPKAIEKWMPQIVVRLTTERSNILENADAEAKPRGGKVPSQIAGRPPNTTPDKSIEDYLGPMSEGPARNKDGTLQISKDGSIVAPKKGELVGSIDAAVEAGLREKLDASALHTAMRETIANLKALKIKVGSYIRQQRAKNIAFGHVHAVTPEMNRTVQELEEYQGELDAAQSRAEEQDKIQIEARRRKAEKDVIKDVIQRFVDPRRSTGGHNI